MNSLPTVSRSRRGSIQSAIQRRYNSTQAGPKPVSPHVGFYKIFTRPVAKVLLMSVFVYQMAYLGWTWLEKDEIKAGKKTEIGILEKQLEDLTKNKKTPENP